MWATPTRLLKCGFKIIFGVIHISTSDKNTFRSVLILIMTDLKTEKRPVLTTNRFSLQAGIKPP